MLKSRIPARFVICRQSCSYLQTNHVICRQFYPLTLIKERNVILLGFYYPAFRSFCKPALIYATIKPPYITPLINRLTVVVGSCTQYTVLYRPPDPAREPDPGRSSRLRSTPHTRPASQDHLQGRSVRINQRGNILAEYATRSSFLTCYKVCAN